MESNNGNSRDIAMERITVLMFVVVLFSAGVVYSAAESDGANGSPYEKRWGSEINVYKQWDAKNSFPDDAILFVGSSSIRLWETVRFFPELKLINRGFGGSDIKAVNYFFDKIVSCYKPSKIVFYAGDNDIAGGLSPEGVCEDFKVFCRLCSEKLDGVEIIFISIKPSGQRMGLWPEMKEANSLIEKYCQLKSHLKYTDLASCLLDDAGVANDELFKRDRLHLNEAGYRLWAAALRPFLVVPKKIKAKGCCN